MQILSQSKLNKKFNMNINHFEQVKENFVALNRKLVFLGIGLFF